MEKPDIIETIQNEGVELRRRGRSHWAQCPFHNEKKPSFAVNPDKQRFKCFGCGEHGDVVDFVIKLKGLSFRDALTCLGMKPGARPRVDRKKERQREAQQQFGVLVSRLYRNLCGKSRELNSLRIKVKKDPGSLTEDGAIEYALNMGKLTEIDYALDLLWEGTAEEQMAVLKEYRHHDNS